MNRIETNKNKLAMKPLRVVLTICAFAGLAVAQDPLKSLPRNYRLQFENEWAKVTRVHYDPHEKLPAHQHTLTGSAYIYLNDGGPVVFKHIGLAYGAVTRPATKAGSFRLYRGLTEIHEVENLSELPSDFLRVEFMTEPINDKTLQGRFYRQTYPAGENFQKVQFENEQIRITRLVCAKGNIIEVTTIADQPALLVALAPASLKRAGKHGKATSLTLAMGQSAWVAAGQEDKLQNLGDGAAEFLRFDFKTKPLSQEKLEEAKKPEHPKQ